MLLTCLYVDQYQKQSHRAITKQPVHIRPQSLLCRVFILFKFDGIGYCVIWSVAIPFGKLYVALSEGFVLKSCLHVYSQNRLTFT